MKTWLFLKPLFTVSLGISQVYYGLVYIEQTLQKSWKLLDDLIINLPHSTTTEHKSLHWTQSFRIYPMNIEKKYLDRGDVLIKNIIYQEDLPNIL